jgi:hypothetical protein
MGEMTGEVKGEMKMAKTLYLKGLKPSDGRDRAFFDNYLFPPWEQYIPSLGTKHSHRGNNRLSAC